MRRNVVVRQALAAGPPPAVDEPGTIALTTTSISVNEGSNATITASRTGGSDGAAAADWAVSDVTTTPQSGTFNWADGDGSPKSASVLAGLVESTESGTVTLSNARRTDGGSPAPVLGTASGSITVNDVPTPPDPGEGYDLTAAVAALPFTLDLPAPPVITSEATCTTSAEITASLAVNGRRTIVAPGTYSISQLTISGSDKHLLLQPGAVITFTFGLVVTGGSRILVEGGQMNKIADGEYMWRISNGSDYHFRGVTVRANEGRAQGMSIASDGSGTLTRLALEGVDFESRESTGFIGTAPFSHFVIANSRIFSTEPPDGSGSFGNGWAMRWNGSNSRIAYLDSYFRAVQNTVLRHSNTDNLYVARCQIENGSYLGFRTESSNTVSNTWFIDNLFHHIAPNALALARLSGTVTNLTATGNQGFVVSGAGEWFSDTTANPVTVMGGYNAPPVWEMQ